MVVCDVYHVFSLLVAFKPGFQIITAPNPQITAHLTIIQLNILIQKQTNLTMAFYYEISKHFQSILANISRTKQLKYIPNFS